MLVFLTLVLKLSKRIKVLVDMLEMKLYIHTEVVESSFPRGGAVIHIDDNTVANFIFKYGRIVMCSLLSTIFRSSFNVALKEGSKFCLERMLGALIKD